MPCENPLRIPNPRYKTIDDRLYWLEYYSDTFGLTYLPDEYIDTPCGKCYSCKKSYVNGWRLRLRSEFSRYPNSIFITLTFDDANLKRFYYAPNRAVRLFLDRVRKKFGKTIRHFIIGEYGSKTGRFHYHGILFNVDKKLDCDLLSKLWKYGFVYIGYCNEKTISYILKYITKDTTVPNGKKVPRLIVSKGIGESFVDDYKNEPLKLKLKPFLTMNNGAKIVLPRYLRDKLFDIDDLCAMKVVQCLSPFERYVDGVKYNDYDLYKKALKAYFNKNISLGLSVKPIKKIRKISINPIKSEDIRYISPFDKFDFYSPNEIKQMKSCFDIDTIPF